MAEGWLDAVTDATIWGRVTGEDVKGPVPLRIEVDGRLWGYARAGHVDPEGGPWRFAVAHRLADGQAVSVFAVLVGQEPLLLEGSPRRVPASAPPRGRLESVASGSTPGPWGCARTAPATATRSPWPGRRRPPPRATWPRGSSTRRSPTRPGRSPSTWSPSPCPPPRPSTWPWPWTCSRAWRRPRRWPAGGGRRWPSTATTPTPGAPAGDEVAMFTPEAVALERPPADATSARRRAAGPAAVRADGWAETAYMVEEVGQLGGSVPAGTVVLSTPPDGAAAAGLAALEPGDQVTVAWSFAAWPGILDTSGGNPTLVRNGRVLAGNVDGTTPFHRRNPRTGVGTTADGRLLLVTVDGRRPGHSVGMTLRELAELFVGLGATSAINLDGGGSTTMVVDGTVVNRISDAQERRVPTAVLVLAGPIPAVPPALPAAAALAPEADQAAQQADLEAIAADPGSTAGLLGSLPEPD